MSYEPDALSKIEARSASSSEFRIEEHASDECFDNGFNNGFGIGIDTAWGDSG